MVCWSWSLHCTNLLLLSLTSYFACLTSLFLSGFQVRSPSMVRPSLGWMSTMWPGCRRLWRAVCRLPRLTRMMVSVEAELTLKPDGSQLQKRCSSSADALELCLFCNNQWKFTSFCWSGKSYVKEGTQQMLTVFKGEKKLFPVFSVSFHLADVSREWLILKLITKNTATFEGICTGCQNSLADISWYCVKC